MSKHQKPLRAALIGLSSSGAGSWAANAHLPNLVTPAGRSRYNITALLNSSEEAAKSAIKKYNLASTTKAYGTPEALAQDKDIDVVICNTRVDQHYSTILPSIKAGQDVYVEWPIAHDIAHIEEVVEAARASGSRVAVGIHRRWLPPVLKVKELIRDGGLGKVLSAHAIAYGGREDRQTMTPKIKYFADRKIGGNVITISSAHALDYILDVLGNIVPETASSRLQNQRPDIGIKDPQTGEIIETVRSDVPDLQSLHATIKPSQFTAPDATLTYYFRTGQPFPGSPHFTFTINCELGEIQLLSPSSLAFEFAPPDAQPRIRVHRFEKDVVEDVAWEWSKEQLEVPQIARGVQTSLYAFADGTEAGDGWVALEDAAERARLFDGFFRAWDAQKGKSQV